MASRLFEFKLWLAPDRRRRRLLEWSNALFAAGADDCSPGIRAGKAYVSFHREAKSLEAAVRSAYLDVRTTGRQVLCCEIDQEEIQRWTA